MATFVLPVALTLSHPLFHSSLLAQVSMQQLGRAIFFIVQSDVTLKLRVATVATAAACARIAPRLPRRKP